MKKTHLTRYRQLFEFRRPNGGNLLSAALYSTADETRLFLWVGLRRYSILVTDHNAPSYTGPGRWSW